MTSPYTLSISSLSGSYEVIIGHELLAQVDLYLSRVVEPESPLLIVYDERLENLGYVDIVHASLRNVFAQVHKISVPSGEASKSLSQAARLYETCVACGLDRQAVLVALGGGVIGDLTGFVAATYMRGVRFVQVPTTLLAHDSSIGGKVAIDIAQGKNLVGAFHAPKLVLYDVATLASLTPRDLSSGLAEAIKHGMIKDYELFFWIRDHANALVRADVQALERLLARSCQVKADIVSVDEREAGLRAILNFGHTIGHALEMLAEGELTHGEAVSLGMVLETQVAIHMGLAHEQVLQDLNFILQEVHLPIAIPASLLGKFQLAAVLELMRHDKKSVRRSLSFVLPKAIGEVVIRKDVPEEHVLAVLEALLPY